MPATDDGAGGKIRQFNPLSPPSLTHTKVLAIEFCGQPLERGHANWNGLLNAAVRAAKSRAKAGSPDLKQLVIIPYVDGHKTDEGYQYLPELGLSVQGQDANGAWKAACHIAQKLGLALTARFVWRGRTARRSPASPGSSPSRGAEACRRPAPR